MRSPNPFKNRIIFLLFLSLTFILQQLVDYLAQQPSGSQNTPQDGVNPAAVGYREDILDADGAQGDFDCNGDDAVGFADVSGCTAGVDDDPQCQQPDTHHRHLFHHAPASVNQFPLSPPTPPIAFVRSTRASNSIASYDDYPSSRPQSLRVV